MLLLDDFTLRICDLGRKNGTFVDGRFVGAGDTILLQDDVVSIGEITFLIDFNQSHERTQAPTSSPSPAMEGTGIYEGETEQANVEPSPPRLQRHSMTDKASADRISG